MEMIKPCLAKPEAAQINISHVQVRLEGTLGSHVMDAFSLAEKTLHRIVLPPCLLSMQLIHVFSAPEEASQFIRVKIGRRKLKTEKSPVRI